MVTQDKLFEEADKLIEATKDFVLVLNANSKEIVNINFSSEEDMRFLKMFDRSGMTSKSAFIKARIFGVPFHVVKFDKGQHEYYAKLSDFHAQFRMVDNNYNQTLKRVEEAFL